MNTALKHQVGGSHYKELTIQPVEYIHANNIGYFEGCAIKYISRWRSKGGLQDLEKAKHYLDLLIELESKVIKPKAGGLGQAYKWICPKCSYQYVSCDVEQLLCNNCNQQMIRTDS